MAFIIFFILIEIGVFIVEALLYNWYLKKYSIKELSKWKPSVYAFVANAASFALGIGLSFWCPAYFKRNCAKKEVTCRHLFLLLHCC